MFVYLFFFSDYALMVPFVDLCRESFALSDLRPSHTGPENENDKKCTPSIGWMSVVKLSTGEFCMENFNQ